MVKLLSSMVPVFAGALIACAGAGGDVTAADALGGGATDEATSAVSEPLRDLGERRPDRDRPVDRRGDDGWRRERPSGGGGGRGGRGHADLCNQLKMISDVNSDEASDAYGRGDEKAGREHADVADRAWEDAKDQGCRWAV